MWTNAQRDKHLCHVLSMNLALYKFLFVFVFVMVALPNIGGALCSTPQILARAHCSTVMQ